MALNREQRLAAYSANRERLAANFSRLVIRSYDDEPDGCWNWQGGRCSFGHGIFGVRVWSWDLHKSVNTNCKAHQFAFWLANGYIPEAGKVIRHTCDNPRCVNPAHLIEGTYSDNMRDMHSRGRSRWGKRGAT